MTLSHSVNGVGWVENTQSYLQVYHNLDNSDVVIHQGSFVINDFLSPVDGLALLTHGVKGWLGLSKKENPMKDTNHWTFFERLHTFRHRWKEGSCQWPQLLLGRFQSCCSFICWLIQVELINHLQRSTCSTKANLAPPVHTCWPEDVRLCIRSYAHVQVQPRGTSGLKSRPGLPTQCCTCRPPWRS